MNDYLNEPWPHPIEYGRDWSPSDYDYAKIYTKEPMTGPFDDFEKRWMRRDEAMQGNLDMMAGVAPEPSRLRKLWDSPDIQECVWFLGVFLSVTIIRLVYGL